ncbi:aminotransferase class IV [Escherichia coli]|nr:aminotransferase class IV [Escherichia coli]
MEACRDVIRKNNFTSAYIRPLIFVGDVGMGVNPPAGYSTDVIIAAFPWGSVSGRRSAGAGDRCDGFLPGTAQHQTPSRRRQKPVVTTSSSSLLVGSEARRHGYQEGIAPDVNGYISEGAGENLFEVKDGVLFTPTVHLLRAAGYYP